MICILLIQYKAAAEESLSQCYMALCWWCWRRALKVQQTLIITLTCPVSQPGCISRWGKTSQMTPEGCRHLTWTQQQRRQHTDTQQYLNTWYSFFRENSTILTFSHMYDASFQTGLTRMFCRFLNFFFWNWNEEKSAQNVTKSSRLSAWKHSRYCVVLPMSVFKHCPDAVSQIRLES